MIFLACVLSVLEYDSRYISGSPPDIIIELDRNRTEELNLKNKYFNKLTPIRCDEVRHAKSCTQYHICLYLEKNNANEYGIFVKNCSTKSDSQTLVRIFSTDTLKELGVNAVALALEVDHKLYTKFSNYAQLYKCLPNSKKSCHIMRFAEINYPNNDAQLVEAIKYLATDRAELKYLQDSILVKYNHLFLLSNYFDLLYSYLPTTVQEELKIVSNNKIRQLFGATLIPIFKGYRQGFQFLKFLKNVTCVEFASNFSCDDLDDSKLNEFPLTYLDKIKHKPPVPGYDAPEENKKCLDERIKRHKQNRKK
jgi:hypothetical protein